MRRASVTVLLTLLAVMASRRDVTITRAVPGRWSSRMRSEKGCIFAGEVQFQRTWSVREAACRRSLLAMPFIRLNFFLPEPGVGALLLRFLVLR